MKKDGIIYTVIFAFFITLLIVGILAFVNELTKKRVALNNEIALKKSVLNAFQINYSDNEDLMIKYNSKIKEHTLKTDNQEITVYSTEVSGNVSYSSVFSGSGLWGTITCIVAVDEDRHRITGMDIINHNETPGLGGRIDEPEFKEQFTGLNIPDNAISIIKSSSGKTGEIEAISGATLSSKALEKIINNALLKLQEYTELLNEK
jgi:Na+-transporting NADH:ubiquinone oxidoreductase subunit C